MTGINGKNKQLEIALIDNLTEIDFLEDFLQKPNTKIITFDYKSHTILKKRNIDHQISDEYLEDNTIDLQKLCYKLVKWYELESVNSLFSYENINLAKLFSDQFLPSLVSIIKKFFEIEKIIRLNSNSIFLATGDLLNIVKIFNAKFYEIDIKNTEKFYFDNISLKFNIGKNTFSIPISFKTYQIFKNLSEKILDLFFSYKLKYSQQTKFTLLVELNTKYFGEFFSKSKKINKKLLFYGRRRPAIWDLKSFRIFRNSGCKLFMPKNKKNFSKINLKTTKHFQNIFLDLLDSEEVKIFFTINSYSLLSVVKPKLVQLIFSKIKYAIEEIEYVKLIFDKHLIDSAIVLSEMGFSEQIVCKFGERMSIPVFHIQEGFHYDTSEFSDRMNALGGFSHLSKKNIVWGEISKNYAIKFGKINPEKIVELGSPRFSNLVYDENLDRDDFILLATMPPQNEEINGINSKNLIKYLNDIEKICHIVTKNKKKLIIKLHPTLDVLELSDIIPKKFPNVKVISNGEIEPLIRCSSLVIVTGISTVIIQSQILKKPVISIPLIDYNFGVPSIYKNNGCYLCKISDLEILLEKIEFDNDFKKKLIKNGNDFIEIYLKNQHNSSDSIWNYIKKHIK